MNKLGAILTILIGIGYFILAISIYDNMIDKIKPQQRPSCKYSIVLHNDKFKGRQGESGVINITTSDLNTLDSILMDMSLDGDHPIYSIIEKECE